MFKKLYNFHMIVSSSEFVKSVSKFEDLLNLGALEFAFVGRSNCGKSSLINMLTSRKKLAKTSQTPGHTKLVNYFLINKNKPNMFVLVDLPGYGFSRAGKEQSENWSPLIEGYLLNGKNLKRVFVLIDCRHKPTENDLQLINFLYYNQIPFSVVLTKVDKLSKAQLSKNLPLITATLKLGKENLIKSSSQTGQGREEILNLIEQDLLSI